MRAVDRLEVGSLRSTYATFARPCVRRSREELLVPADTFDPTSLSLLQRAGADDQEAWQQLVYLYGPLVQRWCRRAGLNDEDTADVFQETFRALAGHLASFAPTRETGSFRSWLRTIVRTKVADHFRRLQRHAVAQGGTHAQMRLANVVDPLADEDDDSDDQAASENAEVVQRALELIKPEFHERNWNSFWQVAVEGKSVTEVAEQLNVNPQTIRQANYRIRRRLRLVLRDLVE